MSSKEHPVCAQNQNKAVASYFIAVVRRKEQIECVGVHVCVCLSYCGISVYVC